jgi:hypothetical protein
MDECLKCLARKMAIIARGRARVMCEECFKKYYVLWKMPIDYELQQIENDTKMRIANDER